MNSGVLSNFVSEVAIILTDHVSLVSEVKRKGAVENLGDASSDPRKFALEIQNLDPLANKEEVKTEIQVVLKEKYQK